MGRLKVSVAESQANERIAVKKSEAETRRSLALAATWQEIEPDQLHYEELQRIPVTQHFTVSMPVV